MKNLLSLILFFVSLTVYSQTRLTKDYNIYAYYQGDNSVKDKNYIWIKNDENSYYMNFPTTASGLQNIIDLSKYILMLSEVENPTSDQSVLPDNFYDKPNLIALNELISQNKAFIRTNFTISDKELLVSCVNGKYFLLISEK
ncbi:hypothetical protein N0B16_10285 [Chryseobacterium sp. GMJ5]|uniref:Uncharacterized protein n=1 Tax=Chryseobacterium gilvum TaxID=2976534 RepID=A0ABT2W0J1_9FLAO|nr:hypothetical protein [Chryseobacterium gilvum]MCU7614824.1 hypothetical protein [Chryseobacterium gilvum]